MRVVLIIYISFFLCMQGQLTAAHIETSCASNIEACCLAGNKLSASSCCAANVPSNNKRSCQGSCHLDIGSNNTHWQIGSSTSKLLTTPCSYKKTYRVHIQAHKNIGIQSKIILPPRPQKRIYYSVWRL